MKVRILEEIAKPVIAKPGEIVDVSHKEAIHLEAHGYAEFVREQIAVKEASDGDPDTEEVAGDHEEEKESNDDADPGAQKPKKNGRKNKAS